MFRIEAEHYFASGDTQAGLLCPPKFVPVDDKDAGYIPSCLEVSVGSGVLLLRNLDMSRGLVNGAMGVVHNIELNDLGRVQYIHVLFDELTSSNSNNSTFAQRPVAIAAIEQTFINGGRSIIRRNFPLCLSWACSIHKIQGTTTNCCFVDCLFLCFILNLA